MIAQISVPVGTPWAATFNFQGRSVHGHDYSEQGMMVTQDGPAGIEATDTTVTPDDQHKEGTGEDPGGGH